MTEFKKGQRVHVEFDGVSEGADKEIAALRDKLSGGF
jgi:hypothetical protein